MHFSVETQDATIGNDAGRLIMIAFPLVRTIAFNAFIAWLSVFFFMAKPVLSPF
jgi:hypothetical protein